ncbi:MAG: type 4 fimbrial biogenesis protein PilZ [Porticoccaceae bacterium]|nr:MAG: type 4 fimbrial biogenesis protein PilZ [Porticoccaceae bacterium]
MKGLKHAIINLAFDNLDALYAAYMPFVVNGGLFVETRRLPRLGDEVFAVVSLPEDPEKYPVSGKVVWITPQGASGPRKTGFGIRLSPDHADLVSKIERLLAGRLNAERPTLTL